MGGDHCQVKTLADLLVLHTTERRGGSRIGTCSSGRANLSNCPALLQKIQCVVDYLNVDILDTSACSTCSKCAKRIRRVSLHNLLPKGEVVDILKREGVGPCLPYGKARVVRGLGGGFFYVQFIVGQKRLQKISVQYIKWRGNSHVKPPAPIPAAPIPAHTNFSSLHLPENLANVGGELRSPNFSSMPLHRGHLSFGIISDELASSLALLAAAFASVVNL